MYDDLDNTYERIKIIGEGGICTVWQISDLRSGEIYAFKQLKDSTLRHLQALKNEYAFLKFHEHPGLVRVKGFYRSAVGPGIVIDFLPGVTLESECGQYKAGDLRRRFLELLEIANFVYHSGYIYNDYKPRNFLLDENGAPELIDFNLVQHQDESSGNKSGTLGYMAPEVMMGRPVSPLSDIYALGATFYEMVSGRPPFRANDEGSLIAMVTESRPEPLAAADPIINKAIMKMLEPDSDRRPGNPYEVCRLLGLEQELSVKISERAEFYLKAGLWPYINDIMQRARGGYSASRPLMVLSENRYENDSLCRALARDAEVSFDNVEVLPSAEMPTGLPEFSAHIDKVNDNEDDREIVDRSGLVILNCGETFSNDILKAVLGTQSDHQRGLRILCFTASSACLEYQKDIDIYSVRDLPDKHGTYIKHFLKMFSLSRSNLDELEDLSDGDPQVLYHYLKSAIENRILNFGDEGWFAEKNIEASPVPVELIKSTRMQLRACPEAHKELISFLAIYGFPISSEWLADLSRIAAAEIRGLLAGLVQSRWVKQLDNKFDIKGKARALALAALIDESKRLNYHKDILNYLERNGASEFEVQAYHALQAHQYAKATIYNYKAAKSWFDQFDLKKAKKHINDAEIALLKTDVGKLPANVAVEIYILAGDIAKSLAENAAAEQKYLRAIELAQKEDNPDILAEAYKNLGDAYRLQQQPAEAIEMTNKALQIYKELEDLPHQGACFNNLGLACWISGSYDQALKHFFSALDISKRLGDLTEQTKLHNNIAIIYDMKGQKSEALQRFEKALECSITVKNPQMEVKCLDNIGYFYLSRGLPQKSLDYFLRSYELAVKIGFDEGQLNVVSNIAQAYHKMGDFVRSADANQKALKIAKDLSHDKFQAQAAYLLAADCLALGNYRKASEMLDQAEAIYSRLSNPELLHDVNQARIDLALRIGNLEQGEKLLDSIKPETDLTNSQRARYYLQYIKFMVLNTEESDVGGIEELIGKIRKTGLDEFVAAALVEKSKALLNNKHIDLAEQVMVEYHKYEVKDILIELGSELVEAGIYVSRRLYDQALEIFNDLSRRANELGCVEILFQALVGTTSIYAACGKHSQIRRLMDQARIVHQTLLASLPEENGVAMIQNLPEHKSFRSLSDMNKESADKRRRVVPEK